MKPTIKHFTNEGITITCDRALGDEEIESLIYDAKLMDVLDEKNDWVGFGTLYRTTKKGEFHFIDPKYVEETE